MALYKRGKVWWISFSYNGRRVRRSTEVTDKKLAENIYCKVKTQVAEGKWFERLEGEDKTIGDLLDKYISEYAVPNKAPTTVKGDISMAKEMREFFEDRNLKEITPRLVADYKARCRKKGLSPSSINHRRGLLSHAFKLAIREWEWVSENPVVRVGRERDRNARDRWLTVEEENRLIDASVSLVTCQGNIKEPRYWLQEIVIFALNTGMRQDEILSLEWPNVDLFRKTATVLRSKNGEKRTIPLNERVFELLKVKAKVRSIRSKYVFTSAVGSKIIARNLLRAFYAALKRVGIEDFRFHDLRHTFATRLVQAGVDLYKVWGIRTSE